MHGIDVEQVMWFLGLGGIVFLLVILGFVVGAIKAFKHLSDKDDD